MKSLKKTNRQTIIEASAGVLSVCVLFLLIQNADEVKQNVLNRLFLCVNTLLPSVFPMLIVSSFLTQIGLPEPIKKLWNASIGKLCDFPENGASAAIFGMIAGYPAGIKSTAILFRKKEITEVEAVRLCLSCVHPGISFSVLAVGRGFFHSDIIGWMFYFSVFFADLITAKLSALVFSSKKDCFRSEAEKKRASLSQALISSVDIAIRTMTEITAWVLLFSVPETLIQKMSPLLFASVSPIAEVTAAALAAAERSAPALCAFSLGFGGNCVHLQLSKDLREMGVRPSFFLLSRVCAGGLSALLSFLCIRLFPQIIPTVLSQNQRFMLLRSDLTGFISLCAVCLLFITETADINIQPIFRHKKQRKA